MQEEGQLLRSRWLYSHIPFHQDKTNMRAPKIDPKVIRRLTCIRTVLLHALQVAENQNIYPEAAPPGLDELPTFRGKRDLVPWTSAAHAWLADKFPPLWSDLITLWARPGFTGASDIVMRRACTAIISMPARSSCFRGIRAPTDAHVDGALKEANRVLKAAVVKPVSELLAEIQLPGEEFREIPAYPNYWISSHGRVVSGVGVVAKLLSPGTRGAGYQVVRLAQSGKSTAESVHRLVLTTFSVPPDGEFVVRHKNGDHSDNRLTNLEYSTQQEIMAEVAVAAGKYERLLEDELRIVWDLHLQNPKLSATELLLQFGVLKSDLTWDTKRAQIRNMLAGRGNNLISGLPVAAPLASNNERNRLSARIHYVKEKLSRSREGSPEHAALTERYNRLRSAKATAAVTASIPVNFEGATYDSLTNLARTMGLCPQSVAYRVTVCGDSLESAISHLRLLKESSSLLSPALEGHPTWKAFATSRQVGYEQFMYLIRKKGLSPQQAVAYLEEQREQRC